MLTLTRKAGESIRIGDDISIVIKEIKGRQVRIGIVAPRNIYVCREELYLKIQEENIAAHQSIKDMNIPDEAGVIQDPFAMIGTLFRQKMRAQTPDPRDVCSSDVIPEIKVMSLSTSVHNPSKLIEEGSSQDLSSKLPIHEEVEDEG